MMGQGGHVSPLAGRAGTQCCYQQGQDSLDRGLCRPTYARERKNLQEREDPRKDSRYKTESGVGMCWRSLCRAKTQAAEQAKESDGLGSGSRRRAFTVDTSRRDTVGGQTPRPGA